MRLTELPIEINDHILAFTDVSTALLWNNRYAAKTILSRMNTRQINQERLKCDSVYQMKFIDELTSTKKYTDWFIKQILLKDDLNLIRYILRNKRNVNRYLYYIDTINVDTIELLFNLNKLDSHRTIGYFFWIRRFDVTTLLINKGVDLDRYIGERHQYFYQCLAECSDIDLIISLDIDWFQEIEDLDEGGFYNTFNVIDIMMIRAIKIRNFNLIEFLISVIEANEAFDNEKWLVYSIYDLSIEMYDFIESLYDLKNIRTMYDVIINRNDTEFLKYVYKRHPIKFNESHFKTAIITTNGLDILRFMFEVSPLKINRNMIKGMINLKDKNKLEWGLYRSKLKKECTDECIKILNNTDPFEKINVYLLMIGYL